MAAGQLAGDDIFHGMRGNEYDIRKGREREREDTSHSEKEASERQRPAERPGSVTGRK